MRVRFSVVACAVILFLAGGVASAAASTFYIASDGNDGNAGSAESPWQTVRFAVQQLRAGDTLYLRAGIYTGRDNVIDSQSYSVPSGTSWSDAITIAGYPGESVTIRPPAGSEGVKLTQGSPSYLIFQDFVIDMSDQTVASGVGPDAIYVADRAHHNRFLRLEIKNNAANGIVFSNTNGDSPFNEIIDCSIHDNGRFPGANPGYGLYISSGDNLIQGNDVYDNGGYGMHFYDNTGLRDVSRNIVRNNLIHGNGSHGGTNYGIVVAWGADNVISDNIIYGNRGGILVYTRSSNTSVLNNRIFNNGPSPGIALQYYDSPPNVQNNTVYSNASDIVDFGGGNGIPVVEGNTVPVLQLFVY